MDAREDALAMLKGTPDRFVVCAFSLGGIVAFQAALAEPKRIAAMVLISVTGRADPVGNAELRRTQVARAREVGPAVMIGEMLWDNYVAAAARSHRALFEIVKAMAEETGVERFAKQAEIAIARPDVRDDLRTLEIPVLVINGAEDRATPSELGREIAQLCRGRHKILPDAGHFVLMEQSEQTAEAVMSLGVL